MWQSIMCASVIHAIMEELLPCWMENAYACALYCLKARPARITSLIKINTKVRKKHI